MLATAPKMAYLHEPFRVSDPRWKPPYLWADFPVWLYYVNGHNAHAYEDALRRTLTFRFNWRRYYGYQPGLRQAVRATRRWLGWTSRRFRGHRPVMKDPLALFSSEWLAERFGLDVVVMIRHPAAFAGSVKVKRWWCDFHDFLRQEQLMADLLHPFEREVRAKAARNDDLVDQAILEWRMYHHVIRLFRERHPDWHFVRHEDLSRDPVGGFATLFGGLGLPFNETSAQAVRDSSDRGNPADSALATGGAGSEFRLDSVANLANWQRRLTADEVLRVREGTADVARHFYAADEW